ncbi:MAG: hypothetical protein ABR521_13085, partial [Gaiellaceae bacterium]
MRVVPRIAAALALGGLLGGLSWQLVAALGAADRAGAVSPPSPGKSEIAAPSPRAPAAERGAINPRFPGITTFRGNLTRSYYGEGPVPRHPSILWRYPASGGGLCSRSTDEQGTQTWCGVGWTGQPNVVPRPEDGVELRFGSFDRVHHFLDGATGAPVRPSLPTGDLAKGSATSDPDGYPLYYAGSRDNRLRVVALDRPEPTVLWELDATTSVPQVVWNDDWDGAPLVVGDHLLEGGENSWFYVVKL